jgi:hypothetical protein
MTLRRPDQLLSEHQLDADDVGLTMASVTKVLIHSQGNTEGSLKLAIDHYRPSIVFLISNPGTNASKFRDWVRA